jgi:putative membrane protein
MNVILKLVILSIAVFVASYIIPGIKISSFEALVVTAIVLGIINTFVKPILVILTLPLTVITLGIFLLILNGILILIVGSIVPGFYVSGILSAILFGIVVSLVTSALNNLA